ncbi:MAG TPA: efflux RND transporter permease subunit, partial [Planctomycetaceae bacterium]|nr:efflux RND transporter permease subunit [Planctomycetaceae bacterium]
MSLPRVSVENHVLVNVLMCVILFAGCMFAFTLTREMFPESNPDKVLVTAIYPGVQPAEIEKAVTIKIEEAVRDLEEIEKIDSAISESVSQTILTLYNEVSDVDAVVQDVKSKVDAIQDLPQDLEKITVEKLEPRLPVISVAIFGPGSEAERKQAARAVRDDLLLLPGISNVEISGIRQDEISVEVRPEKLLEYDITFQEVADAIRQTNLDVSGGELKGDRSNIAVRTLGEELHGEDLADIVVRSQPDGRKVLLSDIAVIRDGFVESDLESYF